jgi:hypothetical protein
MQVESSAKVFFCHSESAERPKNPIFWQHSLSKAVPQMSLRLGSLGHRVLRFAKDDKKTFRRIYKLLIVQRG